MGYTFPLMCVGTLPFPLMWFQEQRKRGVIAASAGNHALALAYHCHMLNIECTVVTPETAPIMKVGVTT